MTPSTILNPVLFAYHRPIIGELRGFLAGDDCPITSVGEIRVVRTAIELVEALAKRPAELLIAQEEPARDVDIHALINTVRVFNDHLRQSNGVNLDPGQMFEVAEEVHQLHRASDGGGMARFVREYPFRLAENNRIPVLAVLRREDPETLEALVEAKVDGIIRPGMSRGEHLAELSRCAAIAVNRRLKGRRGRGMRTEAKRVHRPRQDRRLDEVIQLNPALVSRIMRGRGGRREDVNFPLSPVMQFMSLKPTAVHLLADGGCGLNDGTHITRTLVKKTFCHQPSTGEVVTAIRNGSWRQRQPARLAT